MHFIIFILHFWEKGEDQALPKRRASSSSAAVYFSFHLFSEWWDPDPLAGRGPAGRILEAAGLRSRLRPSLRWPPPPLLPLRTQANTIYVSFIFDVFCILQTSDSSGNPNILDRPAEQGRPSGPIVQPTLRVENVTETLSGIIQLRVIK